MKNLEFYEQLNAELVFVPISDRVAFIKIRLAGLPESEREDAESFLIFLLAAGVLYEKRVVVAAVHGIRTGPVWQAKLSKAVNDADSSIVVKPIKFGFFDSVRFWLPVKYFRGKKVRHVTSQLRLLVKENVNCDLVIVAHSFGTYLTAHSLIDNPDLDVKRIILCGSVLPEDFRWDSLPNKPKSGGIVNDIGTKDIWPIIAKTSSFGYGASGVNGFNTHTVANRYHFIGHSDFFSLKFFNKYWIPFILRGEVVKSPHTENRKAVSWLASVLTLCSGLSLIILTLLLSVAAFLFLL
jgi:hypothetical protein